MTELSGRGLHTGSSASVRFVRRGGPVRLNGALLSELTFDGETRSTRAAHPAWAVRTVEHLFAALGGLGIHRGVEVVVDGPEVPLLDGGARAFASALAEFERSPPSLRVVREACIEIGSSIYRFAPSAATSIEVEIDFDGLDAHARWDGDPIDFTDRIAPARTFGFDYELDELAARGLANHVTPESVVVVTKNGALSAGRPFSRDEPARHKLLDLVGDLYAHGGPPIGSVGCRRPGHSATHAAIDRAIAEGVIAVVTCV